MAEMSAEFVARIASGTLDRFARSGYGRTTLGDIARRVGLTEAQLQDEFATKEALVAVLTRPLLEQMDALVRMAGDVDSHDPDRITEVLGAYLGVLVDHRRLVEVLLGDPSATACPAVRRLRTALTELRDELVGPAGGPGERIVASSALGAVHRAVSDFTDGELLASRTVVIETAVGILLSDYRL